MNDETLNVSGNAVNLPTAAEAAPTNVTIPNEISDKTRANLAEAALKDEVAKRHSLVAEFEMRIEEMINKAEGVFMNYEDRLIKLEARLFHPSER